YTVTKPQLRIVGSEHCAPITTIPIIHISIESYNILCFAEFNEKTLQCNDFLGAGIPQIDCCLNSKYGFKRDPQSECQSCRSAGWLEWGDWSTCSVSCKEGVQKRQRTCVGQGHCQGEALEVKSCTLQECCAVMGGWSVWTSWSRCSVTCGKGHIKRSRKCNNPAPFCGGTCTGKSSEEKQCDTNQDCPTHGSWGNWEPWNQCSSQCRNEGPGNVPFQSRQRVCNNPTPSKSPPGDPCQGNKQEERACPDLPYCPVDGSWGSWKKDSECTVTCGIGRIKEKRSCDTPPPRYGGRDCAGSITRDAICNTKVPCPLDGQWSDWQEWSPCTRLQGEIMCQKKVGIQSRRRQCIDTTDGGKWCEGRYRESRNCYNITNCTFPGEWSEWSQWGLCSSPCGSSEQIRSRECLPQFTDYPDMVQGATKLVEVTFSGKPIVQCDPIKGELLKVEEKTECRNLPPCK
ncbi:properdin-like, partial [Dendrobates tinctorius]|uniref:properdin-like n=1 Tax=Dendrobates tinctorius TaxID=92724 RepID=UPI003CC92C85